MRKKTSILVYTAILRRSFMTPIWLVKTVDIEMLFAAFLTPPPPSLSTKMPLFLSQTMRKTITPRFVRGDENKTISKVTEVSIRQMQKMRAN